MVNPSLRMTTPRLKGLYPIVDLDLLDNRRIDPVEFSRAVLSARPPLLQLRAKRVPARRTLEVLRALRAPCTASGTLLVVNDRPDLALLAAADAVHVGQDDPSIGEVRAIAPDLAVGVSTHSHAELEAALAARPLYVAYGPVFATTSKERPDPVVGMAGLREASRLAIAAGVPLVAIGGIDAERAREVAAVADAAAVIGALMPASADLAEVARAAARIASAWSAS
jgi:thiamine-phosphate pyrophosphorylase